VEVVPFVVTYNGMATGPAIKRCVEHLMADAPDFGLAIERVDLYVHCQTRDPIIAGLASMESRFQTRLATLPFVRFRRTDRLFEVAYASRWVHSDALFGAARVELPEAEFACLCREFAAALLLVRRRVKRADAFDAARLEAHLQQQLGLLPKSGLTARTPT
jgi:hypothetical protein